MDDLLQKAHSHRTRGEYPEAESCYRQLLTENPETAEACWGLGHTLMNAGDFDTCLESFERAVELEPGNLRYVYDLAMFLTMLGEYGQARPLFEQIVVEGGNDRLVGEARKQLSYM